VNLELLAAAGAGFVLGVFGGVGFMVYLILSSRSDVISACKQSPKGK
jgi:hypothetical protein